MKRLLCLIGFHNWLLNSRSEMRPNCHRVCRRCNRKEVVVAYKTKVIWAKYIESEEPKDSARAILEDTVDFLNK